jgi:hypothetical protein
MLILAALFVYIWPEVDQQEIPQLRSMRYHGNETRYLATGVCSVMPQYFPLMFLQIFHVAKCSLSIRYIIAIVKTDNLLVYLL